MSSFWQQLPFLRIIIPFIAGILLANNYVLNGLNQLILLALTSVGYLIYHKITKNSFKDFHYGIWLNLLFLLLGSITFTWHTTKERLQHFSFQESRALAVQISQKTTTTANGWKAEALVLYGIDSLGSPQTVKGKLMLYGQTDSLQPIPQYGDQLLIKSSFHEISSPKNPGSFNYKIFLRRKGIFHSSYLRKNQFKNLHNNHGNPILLKVYAFQNFVHQVLKQNLSKPGEIGIAEALLYGYDKDIEDDVTDAYSKTGTLHVLAVSGMHVGLIFMILSWIFKPLEKLKKGKRLIPILQIVGIWIYAVICGLSPSILRACVMFSFVIMGKQIKRSSNPFNSLSASAFLLLVIDSNLLYNVGFQLSYAAVGGILGFYPYLYHMLNFSNKLLDEIWKILAVSLAAQTLTMPISIYYFHQLPNYFLLANLLIIPLTTIIIYAGIILLIISSFSGAAHWLGYLIAWLIKLTNGTAQFIANLPYSYQDQLNWNGIHVFFYFLIGLCMLQYLIARDVLILKLMLVLLTSQQAYNAYIFYQSQSQSILTIFSIPKTFAIQYQKGQQAYLWQKEDSLNQKNYTRHIQPSQFLRNITSVRTEKLDTINYMVACNEKLKVYILQNWGMPKNEQIDLLIICGNRYLNLQKLLEQNAVKQVVLNADLSRQKCNALKKILQKWEIPWHDVTENGAFELSL